jgi:hypothetical protein
MDKETITRWGTLLRKEIVPLEDLPFPMREALRRLAEKHQEQENEGGADIHDLNVKRKERGAREASPTDAFCGGPGQPCYSSLSKR